MKRLLAAALLAMAAAQPVWAANIAIFGENPNLENFLVNEGNAVAVVDSTDLANPNFLDPFDLFVYVYDDQGNLLEPNLTAAAASTVQSFVTGNVVLFASDLADTGFPGDETSALMNNAVSFASNKGYIGLLTGACAAMTSNNQGLTALGLIDGSCSGIGAGPGGNPLDIVQPGSPIVAGVADGTSLGNAFFFFATLSIDDPGQIVATNTEDDSGGPIPAIVSREQQEIDEPGVLMLLGLGLTVLVASRRRVRASAL